MDTSPLMFDITGEYIMILILNLLTLARELAE